MRPFCVEEKTKIMFVNACNLHELLPYFKDGSLITGRRISPFGGKGAKPFFYSTGPAAAALAAKEPPVQPVLKTRNAAL